MNSPLHAPPRELFRLCAAALLFHAGAAGLAAQPGPDAAAVAALSDALHADQRAHLWRVGVWGGANLAGGLALLAASDSGSLRRGFGIQSAAWGAVNIGIATVGLQRGPGDSGAALADALGAEQGYAGLLLLNLGLNIAYSAVGATMVLASYKDVRRPEVWRGHGAALIVQGLGLFLLDGVAYLGSRTRLGALTDLAQHVALTVGPESVALVLRF